MGVSFYIYKLVKQRVVSVEKEGKMRTDKIQEPIQDSNDFYSVSNFAPLEKRQTNKKSVQSHLDIQDKIHSINYQIVEELSIITPIDLHPHMLYSDVHTYYYIGKLTPISEQLEHKKREREKMDFISALASLFRKSLSKIQNKFTILLPPGGNIGNSSGMVYFFSEEEENHPRIIIASPNYEFSFDLLKEKINFREIKKQDYEKERIMIQGQYIRLFYGYFLNWLISKNQNIEIFSNFLFDYSFREPPMIVQYEENRNQYQNLRYESESVLGFKKSPLYLIKFQSNWYRDDILKIQKKLCEYEEQYEQKQGITNLRHELQFRFCKYSVHLDQSTVRIVEKDGEKQKMK